jgi:hypothetical protein
MSEIQREREIKQKAKEDELEKKRALTKSLIL